ncbi:MAG TPA: exodeoxyribonuclease VII large subunit [Crenotrichaceae bacterium]|nr:exodeoxyribonuclease VII large subunit [Crenotrichaceae bacterium]
MSVVNDFIHTDSECHNSNQQRLVYSVSQLTRETRNLLTDVFPRIWVEGEISNLAQPASGHLYFTLKDTHAQIRCAMFRSARNKINFTPASGDQILVQAQVSLYEARGDFQLIVEQMEAAGDGALRRAFEALKQRLLVQGLFNEEHKQSLPAFPSQVGVITSPTGAAIQDILAVLQRRFPALPVIIYPTRVQGSGAGDEIAKALQLADKHHQCDALILARGGGSLEDLWAFNEEIVAHTLFKMKTPVITGVGHEIDFTIADFVADVRAATPSAAAETISPDQAEWMDKFSSYQAWLEYKIQDIINSENKSLEWLNKRLHQIHPATQINSQFQRIDELDCRLQRSMYTLLEKLKSRQQSDTALFMQHNPAATIERYQALLTQMNQRLNQTMTYTLQSSRTQLTNTSQALQAISPLATLSRGYALVTDPNTQHIIRSTDQVSKGQRLSTRLGKGSLICTVEEINED